MDKKTAIYYVAGVIFAMIMLANLIILRGI
jgi:hypothetical protein